MIVALQADLARLGYRPGPLDGVAGPRTRAAAAQLAAVLEPSPARADLPAVAAAAAARVQLLRSRVPVLTPAQLQRLAPHAAPGAAEALQVALAESLCIGRRPPVVLGQLLEESFDLRAMEEIGHGAGHPYPPYYGRGLIQLTWRENYAAAGAYLDLDLVSYPELAAEPRVAGRIAAWYLLSRAIPAIIDEGGSDEGVLRNVTHAINGGLRGLDDRRVRTERARAVLRGDA